MSQEQCDQQLDHELPDLEVVGGILRGEGCYGLIISIPADRVPSLDAGRANKLGGRSRLSRQERRGGRYYSGASLPCRPGRAIDGERLRRP